MGYKRVARAWKCDEIGLVWQRAPQAPSQKQVPSLGLEVRQPSAIFRHSSRRAGETACPTKTLNPFCNRASCTNSVWMAIKFSSKFGVRP
jgi:hypothetical protein